MQPKYVRIDGYIYIYITFMTIQHYERRAQMLKLTQLAPVSPIHLLLVNA